MRSARRARRTRKRQARLSCTARFPPPGHFGHHAIFTAWMTIVFPMLLAAYTGQAAWLLSFGDLTDATNPSLCFAVSQSNGTLVSRAGSGDLDKSFSNYILFPSNVLAPGCISGTSGLLPRGPRAAQGSCFLPEARQRHLHTTATASGCGFWSNDVHPPRTEGRVGVIGGASGPTSLFNNVFWHVAGGSFGSNQYKGILVVRGSIMAPPNFCDRMIRRQQQRIIVVVGEMWPQLATAAGGHTGLHRRKPGPHHRRLHGVETGVHARPLSVLGRHAHEPPV